MKARITLFILMLGLSFWQSNTLSAQDGGSLESEKEKDGPTIRYNGLGRTYISQVGIEGKVLESDTSTIPSLTDGEFLLDLAINATPTDKAEVQTILRLRNEFGGFFGAGITVEVRELWARGIIANAVEYRVGDMDQVMTPYTLFSFDPDGAVNEAAIFAPTRELVNYEQFYTDRNTRRLQGAKLGFGLDFTSFLEDMNAEAFIARIRGTDFFTTPTRFITGGHLKFATETLNDSSGLQANFGLNLAHTFDDLQSGNATSGIRNSVYTVDYDVTVLDKKNMSLHLMGESGFSNLKQLGTDGADFEEDDGFMDIGAELRLKKQNITVRASYIDVGPDFFSVAAQSKRIDYRANKSYYNRIGQEREFRMPSMFDFTRDRSLYTFQLSDRLMAYDPRFNNTSPYGDATPNRTGLKLGLDYGTSHDPFEIKLDAALLKEIRGQGTFELKDFTRLRAVANVNFDKIADMSKKLRLTLGYQSESVSRDGGEFEVVDLSSSLIDLGVEAEVFTNFELLFGAKLMSAEGREYIPSILVFNDVRDFPAPYDVDDTESLIAAGLKYNFSDDIHVTLQYTTSSSEIGANNPNDYDFDQFFVLYTMNF